MRSRAGWRRCNRTPAPLGTSTEALQNLGCHRSATARLWGVSNTQQGKQIDRSRRLNRPVAGAAEPSSLTRRRHRWRLTSRCKSGRSTSRRWSGAYRPPSPDRLFGSALLWYLLRGLAEDPRPLERTLNWGKAKSAVDGQSSEHTDDDAGTSCVIKLKAGFGKNAGQPSPRGGRRRRLRKIVGRLITALAPKLRQIWVLRTVPPNSL